MRAILLGTGSAFPSAERLQTGVLLEEDDHRLLVDCGSGVTHRLAQAGYDHTDVDTVLLTHHHLDHVCDLPTLLKARWLDGLPSFTIHGPTGTRGVCEHLFAIDDIGGRAACTIHEHGVDAFPTTIAGFRIDAAETTHSKPCFAYRVDDTLAISGDTAPNADVMALADGVETLVHECSFPDGVETEGHTTPTGLGERLADIEVDRVYLTHIFPQSESAVDAMEQTVLGYADADVTVATDLTEVGESPD